VVGTVYKIPIPITVASVRGFHLPRRELEVSNCSVCERALVACPEKRTYGLSFGIAKTLPMWVGLFEGRRSARSKTVVNTTQSNRRKVIVGSFALAIASIGNNADAKAKKPGKKRKGKGQSLSQFPVCYNRSLAQGRSGVSAQSAWISSYLCDQRVDPDDEVCSDAELKQRCNIAALKMCDSASSCQDKARQNCLAESCFVTGYPCDDSKAICFHGQGGVS
jgi:hypothetical protein